MESSGQIKSKQLTSAFYLPGRGEAKYIIKKHPWGQVWFESVLVENNIKNGLLISKVRSLKNNKITKKHASFLHLY